jgi:hypothetical protein
LEDVDFIDELQVRVQLRVLVVKAVKLWVPRRAGNLLEAELFIASRRTPLHEVSGEADRNMPLEYY